MDALTLLKVSFVTELAGTQLASVVAKYIADAETNTNETINVTSVGSNYCLYEYNNTSMSIGDAIMLTSNAFRLDNSKSVVDDIEAAIIGNTIYVVVIYS